MEIKIISDGTSRGTMVINKETGEVIDDIVSIVWTLTAPGISKAILHMNKVAVEVKCDEVNYE